MTKKKLIYEAPVTTMEELVEDSYLLTASTESLEEEDDFDWGGGSGARQQESESFDFSWD